MNFIDLILLVLLAWGFISGMKNGLVHEVASLAALILGIFGAIHFSDYTSELLIEHFELSGRYLPIISFAVTFIAIVIAVHFLAGIMDKLIKAIALGFVNRIFGAVFGILKTAFILSVLIFLLNSLNDKAHFLPEEKIEGSMLYKPVAGFFPFLFYRIDLKTIKVPRLKDSFEESPAIDI